MGLKDFMFDMFMNATIEERDSILLERAEREGMIEHASYEYLRKVDTYLYRGMLASLRGKQLDDEDFRAATREFMNLIVHGYRTQLKDGYSILVVSPDFEVEHTLYEPDSRTSFRVKIVHMPERTHEKGRAIATA